MNSILLVGLISEKTNFVEKDLDSKLLELGFSNDEIENMYIE